MNEDNDIIFTIPEHICNLLEIDLCSPNIKRYLVKEDGTLWLPWGYLSDGYAWDGIFHNAAELVRGSDPELKDYYSEKINTLVTYHEGKFDIIKGEA